MRHTILMLIVTALLAFAQPLQAGPGDHKGPNGGQMQDIGDKHVEVVVTSGQLVVFVFDAKDAKLSTTGASGKATVLVGGKTSEIVLTPDGDNRLVGRGDFSADSGLAAVVRVTMPGQKPLQARFTPLR